MRIFAWLFLLLTMSVQTVLADDATDSSNVATGANKQQIENTVHQYLVKKPEVIVEALQAYQQKQMDSMQALSSTLGS